MDTTRQIAEAIREHEARMHKRSGRPKKTKNLDGFDDFWEVWPRKVAKKPAQDRWAEISPNKALVERIIAAVQAQVKAGILSADKFTPHPATWLNAGRWTDQLPKEAERASKRRAEADKNARKQEQARQEAVAVAQVELEFAETIKKMSDIELTKFWNKFCRRSKNLRAEIKRLRPDRKELFDNLTA